MAPWLDISLARLGEEPMLVKERQVSHIDFRKRQIFVPKPKGGEAKAFCILLSRQMMSSISRAMKIGRLMHPQQAMTWLFRQTAVRGTLLSIRRIGRPYRTGEMIFGKPTARLASLLVSTTSTCIC